MGDARGTHGRRMANLQFWPVRCRSLGCVRRDFLSMLKSVRGARRMNVHAKGTPDVR